MRVGGLSGAAVLAAACAPAAAPAPAGCASSPRAQPAQPSQPAAPAAPAQPAAPTKPAWEQEWDTLVAESMVRGKYPVAFGLRPTAMQEFFAEGLGKDIKWLDIPVMGFVPGTGIFLASKAPHPNAAKLFTNWFLTKEGQDLHAMNVPTNSARLDAVVGSKYGIGTPGVSYFENSFEREYPALEATRPWLKEISGVG